MTYLDLDGTRLYYEVHGDGSPVVLAHGGGGSHLSWWQQVPELARTHCVITYDHRGFGLSTVDPSAAGPTVDLWRHVDDLEALLDALGIERASLVGQSMGGLTVGGLATTRPARASAVVICSSWGGIRTPEVADWCLELSRAAPSTRAGLFHPTFAERHPELQFLYREIAALTSTRTEQLTAGLRAIGAFAIDGSVLTNERIPTLFIAGEADGLALVMRCVAASLPHARFEIIEEAGHSAYFERPHVFNDLVRRFLIEDEP
jgi:3-oxoadipate enol-lactonase